MIYFTLLFSLNHSNITSRLWMYRMDKFSAIEYRVKTYLSVQGQLPLVSPDWKKLEQQALEKMDAEARSYIAYGAGLQKRWTIIEAVSISTASFPVCSNTCIKEIPGCKNVSEITAHSVRKMD